MEVRGQIVRALRVNSQVSVDKLSSNSHVKKRADSNDGDVES